jgi:hypothetical protein
MNLINTTRVTIEQPTRARVSREYSFYASKEDLFKAFCKLTGARPISTKKITLSTIRKDTSLWSQDGELTQFNLPLRPKEELDAMTTCYDQYVDPAKLTSEELQAIGDLDIPDDHQAVQFPEHHTGILFVVCSLLVS